MRKPLSILAFCSLLVINLGVWFSPVVQAQDTTTSVSDSPAFDSTFLFPTWVDQDPSAGTGIEAITMDGVIGENNDKKRVWQYIPRIINILLAVTAPIVVVMSIYAGILFIYAGDSDDDREKAKKFFMYAVIGLVIIVLSYSIMRGVYYFLATGN